MLQKIIFLTIICKAFSFGRIIPNTGDDDQVVVINDSPRFGNFKIGEFLAHKFDLIRAMFSRPKSLIRFEGREKVEEKRKSVNVLEEVSKKNEDKIDAYENLAQRQIDWLKDDVSNIYQKVREMRFAANIFIIWEMMILVILIIFLSVKIFKRRFYPSSSEGKEKLLMQSP